MNKVAQCLLSTSMPWEIISKHTHEQGRLAFSIWCRQTGPVCFKSHLKMTKTQRSQGILKARENCSPFSPMETWVIPRLASSMRQSRSRHTGRYHLGEREWGEENRGRGGEDEKEVLTEAEHCHGDGAAGWWGNCLHHMVYFLSLERHSNSGILFFSAGSDVWVVFVCCGVFLSPSMVF